MSTRVRPVYRLRVILLLAASGCGTAEVESPTAVRLRALAVFYLDYAVPKNGKGPADEREFKKHLRSLPAFRLEMEKLDPGNLDAVFASERDGEPLVVLYGQTLTQIGGDSALPVAHEKTGKNGKRLVAFSSTKVELVDEARFRQLTLPK